MCTLVLEQLHQSVPQAHQLLCFISEGKVVFRPPDFPLAVPIPTEPD
jgi:hypothetical protein